MPFIVPLDEAAALYPQYTFVTALTPSEQKAAFHVRDSDGTDLCLKLIAPNHDIDRVAREIESMQELSHPNVVGIVDYTLSIRSGERRHHVVEEFVDGTDLTDVLLATPLTLDEAADLFAGILSGLEAVRLKDIVHRDLKPANIRVRSDGVPVIIDFGLARRLRAPDLTDTAAGAAIGTPIYFAPEQFRGEKRDIDHRTDLFAAGVLLYEAVVGQHPFFRSGMTRGELETVVCESDSHLELPAFANLPSGWQLLVRQLLAKDRVSRPATADRAIKLIAAVRRREDA